MSAPAVVRIVTCIQSIEAFEDGVTRWRIEFLAANGREYRVMIPSKVIPSLKLLQDLSMEPGFWETVARDLTDPDDPAGLN